jgi:hypothetical protein
LPQPVDVPGLQLLVPLAIPPVEPPASPHGAVRPTSKSYLPAEFEHDSGFFCQKRIGAWTEEDACNLLGTPLRRCPALDSNENVNGYILAYSDPAGSLDVVVDATGNVISLGLYSASFLQEIPRDPAPFN